MVKKVFIIFLVVIVIMVVVFILGPRVEVDTTLEEVELPDDFDAYLQSSEAALDDITPGAEKTIIWAGEVGEKTPLSVVYLHGFSATRQETAPLADEVAAELGANLYYDRFTGHGRSGEALATATVNDWLNDSYRALEIGRRLGDEVIIIATSTGGSAAAWLVAQPEAEDVHALILISPNFAPVNKASQILTLPWGEQITNLIVGEQRSWEPSSELHDLYWTNNYPTKALLPMQALVDLSQKTAVEKLDTPLLLVYSPNDQVVNPAASEAFFNRYGATNKQLAPIEQTDNENNHVIAGDIMSPGTTEEVKMTILQFLQTENN